MDSKPQFLQMILEHQRIIHKICNLYCDNKEDKEDLFQEILFQSWRSFESFQGRSKISTWLYQVALNTALVNLKKEKRRVKGEEIEVGISVVEEQSVKKEEHQLLHRALNDLNEIEKSIMMLYLEEVSYREIAEIMGLTETNVGVKINRIKIKLKPILEKYL